MKSSVFTLLRFAIALLTIAAIAGKPYIPPKTLLIYPAANTISSIYGPSATDGNGGISWMDRDQNEWRCDYRISNEVCGIALSWSGCQAAPHPFCSPAAIDPDGDGWGWENNQSCIVDAKTNLGTHHADAPGNVVPVANCTGTSPNNDVAATEAPSGVDFSRYKGMNVKIHYEGKAEFLRLYLRNYNPHYADNKPADQTDSVTEAKYMSAFLQTQDLKAGETYVSLSEFSVAEWWVVLTDVPRDLALPEFNQIVTVGVDPIEYGIHKIRLERLELVGERISNENFLMILLVFWSGYLLLEAGVRYYYLYSSSRQREAQINQLTSDAEQLEREKNTLKTRSVTDQLTGVFNRMGVQQQLKNWSTDDQLPINSGILMIDIDHFKTINDTHGHDAGDVILKSLAQFLESNIRGGDIFARWGGEEFLLITRYVTKNNLLNIAEKLRVLVAAHQFKAPMDIAITISIGAATTRANDTFETLLKRADIALYKAKKGRNRSIYEE